MLGSSIPCVILPIRSTIFENRLCSPSRKSSSRGLEPAPCEILSALVWLIGWTPSSSLSVIESIMKMNFLILSVDSFSWPLGIIFALKPGIMPTTLLKEPMFSTLLNWSRMSLKVNLPDLI